MRPAQWLGLLKILSAWGAEFFYSGFFSLGQPFPPSQNWCWQAMMPVYAQAMATQSAAFMYDGSLVEATPNTTMAMPYRPGSPLLWAGAPHILAVARRLDGEGSAFLLTVTIQRLSNDAHNLGVGATATAHVAVPGIPVRLSVVARTQGAVFVWRNDTGGKPVLYQLDTWHLASHPLYWRTDAEVIALEAEVFEGHLDATAARAIATEVHGPRTHGGDFTAFTTWVDLAVCGNAGVRYSVPSPRCRGIRVRARIRGGDITAMSLGGRTLEVMAQQHDVPISWEWVTVAADLDHSDGGGQVTLTMSGTAQVDALELICLGGSS